MLRKVLEAVEASEGGTNLRTLSRELGIEPGVLEGMILFWVRKGRLVDSNSAATGHPEASVCARCDAVGCAGAETCPFIVSAPRTLTVASQPAARDRQPSRPDDATSERQP